MFGNWIFVTLWVGLALFMINRLFVGLTHGEINVRGWVYTRESTPVRFWLTILFASLALLLAAFIVAVLVFAY